MKTPKIFDALLFIAILAVLSIFPIDAKAYIDPGTGSLTLQYISSGFLLVLISARVAVARFAAMFLSSRK